MGALGHVRDSLLAVLLQRFKVVFHSIHLVFRPRELADFVGISMSITAFDVVVQVVADDEDNVGSFG